MAVEDIDTMNAQLVGSQGDDILVMFPHGWSLWRTDDDDDDDFGAVLKAVRNT